MKKIYQTPVLQIVAIKTVGPIMGSINSSAENENSFGIGIKTGTATTEFARQDNDWNIWGDEGSDE